MAFPILFPLAGAAFMAARAAPHVFRYLAPKAVTGANRLGQLITKNPVGNFITKYPKTSLFMTGMSGIESMMTPEKAQAPSNPYLQNSLNPYGPFMPYTAPKAEMPLGFDQHPPMPNALESTPQELKPHINEQTQPLAPASPTPTPELTDAEKFLQSNTYKFFQSDAYQKLKDLFAGMAESSSDGSGWDALASGVKHLNEGDKRREQVNQTVEYLKSKGYSEEEAAIMARNPQMLNGFFTQGMNARSSSQQIDNTPPKFSPDYYGVFNPETKQWEAKVIKGSKAYKEKKEKLTKQKQFFESELVSQNTNIRLLDNTEKLVRSTLTGTNILAPIFSILSSTDASILKSNIEAVKKNLARDTLEEMKQKSPNGASGYGNMNIQEFTSLQTRLGNLDTNLRRDILLEEIIAVKEAVLKARSNTQKLLNNWNTEYNDFLSLPILPISQFTHVKNKDDEDRLSKGEVFVDDGGYIRNK
ncbi:MULTISPECIES: hypothetical protein [unclassified Bartonella]|uniref:hypothetical protein n=1 Tax=unclassified Bartonella TaxID=2645622 RepID=UPI0035CF9E05